MKIKKNYYIGLFFLLTSCQPSPTTIWLEEYKTLLQQSSVTIATSLSPEEIEQLQHTIAEKEAEIDSILRNVSVQDQMNFLSQYYDMRIQFYYAVQSQ